MDHPFRSVMFGGFHRQDVLDYLEQTAKQAAELQQALTQQVENLQAEAADSTQVLLQKSTEIASLLEGQEALRQDLEQANLDLNASREESEHLSKSLTLALQELEDLHNKFEQIAPAAQAYEALKDRTAGVELEAHTRAQSVQKQAQQQVHLLHTQTAQWLRQLEHDYDALRQRVTASVSQADSELVHVRQALEQINAMLEDRNNDFGTLSRTYLKESSPPENAPPSR